MKFKFFLVTLMAGSMILFSPLSSHAQLYYHANGGGYWTQWGSEWHTRTNDGYCVSGRGPCTSSLWYHQWTYHHNDCGPADEGATWKMATESFYPGDVSAWIDDRNGTMTGANYMIYYQHGHHQYSVVNQYKFNEEWVPLFKDYPQIDSIRLDDGYYLPCYIFSSPMRVLFDEVKLEI